MELALGECCHLGEKWGQKLGGGHSHDHSDFVTRLNAPLVEPADDRVQPTAENVHVLWEGESQPLPSG